MSAITNINLIKKLIPSLELKEDSLSLDLYGKDYSSLPLEKKPIAVVFPKSTQEIQQLVSHAYKQGIPLIPSGGRTGLTGAASALGGELIVSLEKMNKILKFNSVEKNVTCEPGVILQDLQEYAKKQGFFYPVSLAAKGSCQVGGNIATNAGGINVTRYGNTREQVAGLKIVTGTGELLSFNENGLQKNNTGYALHQLVIGSEGTLGVIVEAVLRLTKPLQNSKIIIFSHPKLEHAINVLNFLQKKQQVIAGEFFDLLALTKVIKKHKKPLLFNSKDPFYSLIEIESHEKQAETTLMDSLEQCFTNKWATDAIINQNEQQAYDFWQYRENITESIASEKPYKFDISVPISSIADFHIKVTNLIKTKFSFLQPIWFGHLADGNIHLNIPKPISMPDNKFNEACKKLTPQLFSIIQKEKGSISAEHGIGVLKKNFLLYSRTESEINIMRQIKKIFDPKGIMNPGKIFD